MISVKKQALTVSAALAAFALTFGAPVLGHAAYQLNPEVKDATPALKEASAIGVRTHNTEALQNLPNKDAMVVMSFGTTYKDTRADVIPGMEYNYDAAVYNLYKDNFKKMTLGTSLMYWMGQENQTDQVIETLKAVQSQFPKLGKEDGLLIMAHGTPDPSNAYYSVIQDRIHTLGMKNVFVYTVEGTPNLEQVIPQLKLHGIKHVTLMPFMMVAGDHANNDMAGNEPDSHKSILEKEGFKVDTYIHGLGENPNIRKLFVERANESWDALQK
ncbi:MAG: sirohydrochlorin cobaltochelatase [Veillonella sp.]|nr:sirohydrochlorin cobaltochelatase [Veillonella sp.]